MPFAAPGIGKLGRGGEAAEAAVDRRNHLVNVVVGGFRQVLQLDSGLNIGPVGVGCRHDHPLLRRVSQFRGAQSTAGMRMLIPASLLLDGILSGISRRYVSQHWSFGSCPAVPEADPLTISSLRWPFSGLHSSLP